MTHVPVPSSAVRAEPALRRVPPWLPLLVVAAAWLAQGAVLRADWGPGDRELVRDNPVVRQGLRDPASLFAPTAWRGAGTDGAWRPLTLLSFALEAPLWEGETGRLGPFGFHLTNLFLHGLVAVLLLALLLRLRTVRWSVAAGAALLCAVHPMQTGTLSTLAGRADVLALLLGLGTAHVWLSATRGRPGLLPLVLLLALLALLAKETAVALPVLILFVVEPAARPPAARGTRGLGALCLAVAVLAWALLSPQAWRGPLTTLVEGLEAIARGAIAFFVPVAQVRDRLELTGGPSAMACWVGGAGALLALAFFVHARRQGAWRVAAAGWAAFVLAVGVAALVASPGAASETRFAYVTGAGLWIVGGRLGEALVAPRGRRTRVGLAATGVLCAGLVGLSWAEASAWRDEFTLLRGLVERHPGSDALRLRLGRRLREEAERGRESAAQLPAGSPEHLALLASIQDLLQEAGEYVQIVARQRPQSADAQRELGFWQLAASKALEAESSLKEALELDPHLRSGRPVQELSSAQRAQLTETYVRLAAALEAQGRVDEAAAWISWAARELDPQDWRLSERAGTVLLRARRYQEALTLLRRAVDLAPTLPERSELHRLFEDAQRAAREAADRAEREAHRAEERREPQQAIGLYETALAADPTRLFAWLRVASLRGEHFGDYRRGYAALDQAEEMLRQTGRADDPRLQGQIDAVRRALEAQQEREEREELEAEGAAPDAPR